MPLSDLTTTNNIVGGTDNTTIGNVGDRLKVDSVFNPSINYRKFIYEEAQTARGTVINPTSWVNVYSYIGSGVLYGFLINLEGANGGEGSRWFFDLLIDNTFSVFGTNGMMFSDLIDNNAYDLLSSLDEFCGLASDANIVKTNFDRTPIYFASSIKVRVRRINSAKKFKAGIVKISKD